MTKKMETKRHFSLARAAMMLLFTVLTTVTAWADTWPEYITNVVLVGGTESEAQSAKSGYSGYTWCSKSLNDGTSGDVIYIGYKTSNSANTNGGYITDFIVVDAVDHNPPSTISCNGHTYYLCPADGADYFANSNHGNLTSHASQGWNIYLYYTKEHFSDKRAVSSIAINDTKSGAIDCYKKDGTLREENISLNRGVKNTPYVYMHIYTETKVNRPYPEPTTISGLTYDGTSHQLIPSNYDSDYSGDVYFRLGTTGSYTSNVNSITATNAGTYTIYYYSGESYYGNSSVDYAHTMTATIAKSANSGLTVACADVVDGNAPAPHLGGSNLSTGAVTYQYSTTQNGKYTTTVPTDFGKYWVKATIAGDDNCNAFTTAAASFYILADANDLWNIKGGANGTVDHPIIISTPSQLDLLAKKVNGTDGYSANTYFGKFFELGKDITYTYDGLGNDESNYTAIGNGSRTFSGRFDGKGYTISGIRIKKSADYQGLFGRVSNAAVKNVTLADTRITVGGANQYAGGIAGNSALSEINNCHVANDVYVTAPTDGTNGRYIGGIIGINGTNIYGCTSAATVSGKMFVGGIAGVNNAGATIQNCLVYGATISGDSYVGAITGINNQSTLTNNRYSGSNINGSTNVGYGTSSGDVAGAAFACAVIPYDGVTIAVSGTPTTQYDYDGLKVYATGMSYGDVYYNNMYSAVFGDSGEVEMTATYTGTVPEGHVLDGFGYTALANGPDVSKVWDATGNTATFTLKTSRAGDYYIAPVFRNAIWGAGDGSQGNPYIITTVSGLNKLSSEVNAGTDLSGKYFELGADIEYDGTEGNFTAIGNGNHRFKSNFDGKGHTISGININTGNDYQGVFGFAEYCTIQNLTVSSSTILGGDCTGGILGQGHGVTLSNCHVTDDVSLYGSYFPVGGICADALANSIIQGCTSAAKPTCKWYSYNGGIVGIMNSGIIKDCLYLGPQFDTSNNGAILGGATQSQNKPTITNCYHTAYGMAFIGYDSSTINTCFAVSSTTKPDGFGDVTMTYGMGDYTGIKAYGNNGLYYNGNYYYQGLWGGNGTEDAPYVIYDTQGLDKLASDVNGGEDYTGTYFALGADITYDRSDNNYTPIGDITHSFSGTFDGKGHTISGIRISDTDGTRKAIFGELSGTVKNLVVGDCCIEACQNIGGIVASLDGTIENCHVGNDVTLSGNSYVGGIAGSTYGGTIKGCTSTAKIIGTKYGDNMIYSLGGIAGYATKYGGVNPTLTDNLFTGTISGELGKLIGAIVGWNNSDGPTFTNNYHTCSGMGGMGNEGSATGSDVAGANIAYELPAANGAMGAAGTTYGTGEYTGITVYENGLAYNGKFYSPSPWGGSGTEADPYIIVNTQGMDLLATNVNGGNYYKYTYFVLGNDIAYDANALTLDLDGDGNNDSNYMPVGKNGSSFYGNFDGQGHTISGIRVNANNMGYIGVFGINASTGTVKNLTVSDCLFAGDGYVGAIAGLNRGTVENCHVAAYVSVTGNNGVGGVVGNNEGSVLGCTSAATLSTNKEYARYFGGIAGGNTGTLTDNLFTGTIDIMPDGSWSIGVITGNNNTDYGTLTNNFHTCSGMGGVGNEGNATNTDQAGALFAVSSDTEPDEATIGTAGTPYAEGETYQGITPYTDGLYYKGLYYCKAPNIVAWKGKGTETDPYVIRTTAELDLLATNVNGGNNYAGTYFELGNDITYTYEGLGEGESNFTPIGENGNWFSGTFDGQGHKVSGIRISDTNGQYKAIFGIVDGTVKNLVVSDCRIEGYLFIGGIVTHLLGTIENCHVGKDVTLSSKSYIGGIATQIDGGTIKGCTSTATIIGTEIMGIKAHSLGGIVGSIEKNGDNTPTLTDNLFTGTISGDLSRYIGAIVGQCDYYETTLTNNYHTLVGLSGIGNENDATGNDIPGSAEFAYEYLAATGAMGAAGTTYGTGDYTGITVYTEGLAYSGKFYSPSPWGGSGTEEDPYIIFNTAGLDKLASKINAGISYRDKYFELGDDITYDGSENNYTPIGGNGYCFSGTFDGQGHKVSGIRISDTNGQYKAIFGIVDGTVKNLVVSDCCIEALNKIGGIAGSLFGGTIENCHVGNDVTLSGNYDVGGIAGNNYRGTVIGCTSAATIIGTEDNGENAKWLGGIVGFAEENVGYFPTLTDNLFTGTISGDLYDYIGAIVGWNNSNRTTLTNNYHTCSGMGGVGNDNDAIGSDMDGALFAASSDTEPDKATIGTAGTAYAYQGITPYTDGLYYNGLYYYKDPNIAVWTGKGTEKDPYVIRTTAELDLLASKVSGGIEYNNTYFELGDDITYDGSENNYTPIGNTFYWFSGTFDGKGHTISGIRISETEGVYKAIFAQVKGTVKNIVVSDCRIEADQLIGGIVAILQGGTIENCHVGSDVILSSNRHVGGIVANILGGTIKGCTSAARIIGTKNGGMNAYNLGGIVSYAGGSGDDTLTLTDNLFNGTISGNLDDYIGAIVSWNNSDETTLTNNYYTAYGLGGVGSKGSATGSDVAGKAEFAVSSDTKPDEETIGTAGTPYAAGETYQGITPYSKGLYYDGRYYWHETILRGDANGDGSVTITDAVAIVNYILGNPSANFNLEAANVNGDTDEHGEPIISITDAVGVVNIILNGGAASAPAFTAPALTAPEDDDASPVDPE